MDAATIDEFRIAWSRVNSISAEAFLVLKGLPHKRADLEELLRVEHALRLNRFVEGDDGRTKDLDEADGNATLVIPTPQKQFGRYLVKNLIAEGGFGSVYLAEDPILEREVAIKSPRGEQNLTESAREEFEREAKLICRLEHTHILPVYDFGFADDQRPYLVCKLIRAKSLAGRLREGINFHEAIRVVTETARALHHAHGHGVVHRDVKPANILIDGDGHTWLADFGLGLQEPRTELLKDRSGTPRYLSPEQAQANAHLVDGRSDIFSLGIILYQSLTGVHPFEGGSVDAILKRILEADVRPPRQINDRIPPQIEAACMRALCRNPAERYSTADDFADDLEEAATYNPRPIDTSAIVLSTALNELLERLAENTHEIWAQRRIREGWIAGPKRDDKKKTHPDLVPFEQLSISEQDYDRVVVREVLLAAIALGSKITPPELE